MSQGTVYIDGMHRLFNVLVNEIRSEGQTNSPTLIVPLKFDIIEPKNGQTLQLISAKSVLSANNREIHIGGDIQLSSMHIRDNAALNLYFRIPMTDAKIHQIEKARDGDLLLTINFELQMGKYEILMQEQRTALTEIITGSGHATFTIEQSAWVNKMLPNLGYNRIRLMEIPNYSTIIPEDYAKSISEFDQAQDYFLKGDYDKTVSHCRVALDPFKANKNLDKLKEYLKSQSEIKWAKAIIDATETWLDVLLKETYQFTSKTHHIPSTGHFSRIEAEIILLITTSIVAYIGTLEYRKD